MSRPNLTVETHVHALSILFEGGRAVGVGGRAAVARWSCTAPSAR